jgi:hypothetical protein
MIQVFDNTLNYPAMVNEALLLVVKASLQTVCNNNNIIPGNHHFYISFLTHFPGAVLSENY